MRSTDSPEEGGHPLENRPPALEDLAVEGRLPAESALSGASDPPLPQQPALPRDVVLRRLVTRRALVVTPLLVAINVAIHLHAIWTAGGGLETLIAGYGHARFAVWAGEYWRLFTATFVHGNVPHLVLNMMVLWMLGRVAEKVLGAWRYLVTYLLCGLAGSLLFQAVSTGTGVGASGAVYGLVGIILWMRYGRSPTGVFTLTRRFVFWIVLLVGLDQVFAWLIEASPGGGFQIATSAHLGGLICGLFLGYFGLSSIERERHPRAARQRALVVCAVIFGVVGAYGCFFPVTDPIWQAWRGLEANNNGDSQAAHEFYDEALEMAGDQAGELAAMITQLEMQAGRYDEAARLWRDLSDAPLDLRVRLGYRLYERLTVAGEDDRAASVLDRLIRLTEEALVQEPTADLHNEIAWFLALRGVRFLDARRHAELALEAVRLARERADSWFQGGRDYELAAYQNTLGWVQFLNGEDEEALLNLTKATELSPNESPHFVYLAVAHWRLGNRQEARKAALRARELGVPETSVEALDLAEVLELLGED